MYQNNLNGGNPAINQSYYPANGYYYPPAYGGAMAKEQSIVAPYSSQPNVSVLKGRPVSSFEEARAAQIDLDGSLHVFTDIGNKKIYTKQINLDGTATLNVYTLQEQTPIEQQQQSEEYITKTEFYNEISKMQSLLNMLTPKEDEQNISSNDF